MDYSLVKEETSFQVQAYRLASQAFLVPCPVPYQVAYQTCPFPSLEEEEAAFHHHLSVHSFRTCLRDP